MDENTTPAAPEPAPAPVPAVPLSKVITPEKKAFLTALAKAQGQYRPIEKNQEAKIRPRDADKTPYSFRYADLDAILDGTRDALSGNGISTRVLLTDHDGDTAWLNSIVAHAEGWEDVSSIRINTVADDIKTFGGRITFLRRYLLGPQIGVAATDDADQDGSAAGEGAAMGDVMQGAKVESRPAGPARKSVAAKTPTPKSSPSAPPDEPPPPEGFSAAKPPAPAAESPAEPPPPLPAINEAEVERQKAGMDARFEANAQRAKAVMEPPPPAEPPPSPPPPPPAAPATKSSLSADNTPCTSGEIMYLRKRMKDHGIAVRATLDELELKDVPDDLTGLKKGQWKLLLPST